MGRVSTRKNLLYVTHLFMSRYTEKCVLLNLTDSLNYFSFCRDVPRIPESTHGQLESSESFSHISQANTSALHYLAGKQIHSLCFFSLFLYCRFKFLWIPKNGPFYFCHVPNEPWHAPGQPSVSVWTALCKYPPYLLTHLWQIFWLLLLSLAGQLRN